MSYYYNYYYYYYYQCTVILQCVWTRAEPLYT